MGSWLDKKKSAWLAGWTTPRDGVPFSFSDDENTTRSMQKYNIQCAHAYSETHVCVCGCVTSGIDAGETSFPKRIPFVHIGVA